MNTDPELQAIILENAQSAMEANEELNEEQQ